MQRRRRRRGAASGGIGEALAKSVQVKLQGAAEFVAVAGISHAGKECRKLEAFGAGHFGKKEVEQPVQAFATRLVVQVGYGNCFQQFSVKQLCQGFVVHARQNIFRVQR